MPCDSTCMAPTAHLRRFARSATHTRGTTMKLGLFTPVFAKLSTSETLARVKAIGKIQALELGTGGWPGSDHLNLEMLVNDEKRSAEVRRALSDARLTTRA